MKLLLAIYSCKKYMFLKEYYLEKYKNMGYDVIYIVGDKTIAEEYKYNSESKLVQLKCEDSFEHLVNKTHLLIQMFLLEEEFKDYDYLIKMDDDTELNINYFQLCEHPIFTQNCDYIGPRKNTIEPIDCILQYGKCSEDCPLNYTPYQIKYNITYGCGFFYILSKNACQIILTCILNNDPKPDFLFEDMMIGKILFDNEINYAEEFIKNITTDLPRPRWKNEFKQNTNNNYVVRKIKKINPNVFREPTLLDEQIKKELAIKNELNDQLAQLTRNAQIIPDEQIQLTEQKKPNFITARNVQKIRKFVKSK